jgi:hypothetical protein
VDDPKGRSPPRARRLCARGVGCAAPLARAHSRGEAAILGSEKKKVVFKHGPHRREGATD